MAFFCFVRCSVRWWCHLVDGVIYRRDLQHFVSLSDDETPPLVSRRRRRYIYYNLYTLCNVRSVYHMLRPPVQHGERCRRCSILIRQFLPPSHSGGAFRISTRAPHLWRMPLFSIRPGGYIVLGRSLIKEEEKKSSLMIQSPRRHMVTESAWRQSPFSFPTEKILLLMPNHSIRIPSLCE